MKSIKDVEAELLDLGFVPFNYSNRHYFMYNKDPLSRLIYFCMENNGFNYCFDEIRGSFYYHTTPRQFNIFETDWIATHSKDVSSTIALYR